MTVHCLNNIKNTNSDTLWFLLVFIPTTTQTNFTHLQKAIQKEKSFNKICNPMPQNRVMPAKQALPVKIYEKNFPSGLKTFPRKSLW